MFTGLTEETGKIAAIVPIPSGKRLTIDAPVVAADMAIGDSVSVSGVCLTVTQINKPRFTVEAVGETLNKTTLSALRVRQIVNLERATRAGDRLGGHIVQGHINGVGRCESLVKSGENWLLSVTVPDELTRYIVNEGSIALDGVSLTVARVRGNSIMISIIPHTYKNTLIRTYRPGQRINIETDVLAKYAEKVLLSEKKQPLTVAGLKSLGY